MRLHRLSLDEEIQARQQALGRPEEGRTFEHGPAKFIFIALLTAVVVSHLVALALLAFIPS